VNQSSWNSADEAAVIARYESRFLEFGYSEKALGWGEKGRQRLRFDVLASHWSLKGKRILDLGAGFGDFYSHSTPLGISQYVGIDVTEVLVNEGLARNASKSNFTLKVGSVTDRAMFEKNDITIISGLFNFRLENGRNTEFIKEVLSLAFEFSEIGVGCNFITDKVDFRDDIIHYQSPLEALEIGYSLTRNCVLRQDYMPFEYSLFLDHRDTFDPRFAIFDHIRKKNE
jgi:hypothetical protein